MTEDLTISTRICGKNCKRLAAGLNKNPKSEIGQFSIEAVLPFKEVLLSLHVYFEFQSAKPWRLSLELLVLCQQRREEPEKEKTDSFVLVSECACSVWSWVKSNQISNLRAYRGRGQGFSFLKWLYRLLDIKFSLILNQQNKLHQNTVCDLYWGRAKVFFFNFFKLAVMMHLLL